MARMTLYFTAPYSVEVREEPIPEPRPHEVRVRTVYSAVSPGTELLVYRGQAPEPGASEEHLDPVSGEMKYPMTYGYSAVGVVDAVGRGVDANWEGRRVFSFQPHTSHFCCPPDRLIPLPDALDDRDAVFIPNMETAVNLVMDGRPMIGERVMILGQGVVGLLTTALLSRFPLEVLVTTDLHAMRRTQSLDVGADAALDPFDASTEKVLQSVLQMNDRAASGADLIFELTGAPAVLNEALRYVGFESRIVVGSWYGKRRAEVNLGGKFHRHRIRIVSSQVSTVASAYRGRWDKERRMETVMQWIDLIKPKEIISDIVSIGHAPEMFDRLDRSLGDALQVVFKYNEINP